MQQTIVSICRNRSTSFSIGSLRSATAVLIPRFLISCVLALSLDEFRMKHVRSCAMIEHRQDRRLDPRQNEKTKLTNEESCTKASRMCSPVSPAAPTKKTFCCAIEYGLCSFIDVSRGASSSRVSFLQHLYGRRGNACTFEQRLWATRLRLGRLTARTSTISPSSKHHVEIRTKKHAGSKSASEIPRDSLLN